MKKTIKKDKHRYILKEEYLNDNALLEYSLENKKIVVGIRFIEGCMKEHILGQYPVREFVEEEKNLIRFNKKKNAIALFRKVGEDYQLDGLYNAEEHSFEVPDFLELAYQKEFPQEPLGENRVYQKKK